MGDFPKFDHNFGLHIIHQFILYNRSRSQKGKRTSTSDDLAPDFANDVKLPSICPAVNVYSLVSLKCAYVCLCDVCIRVFM